MRRVRRIDPGLVVLLALTASALGLRLWGIQHGLPHPTTRPDEREVLDHTAAFATGDLNPRWFIYPPFYFHLTWLWDEAVLAVWRLWRPRPDYFELLKTNLAPLLLGGRILSALAGTLTVTAAWAIGQRVRDRSLAVIFATLVATSYLLVRDSHALKPDAALALGVLVSLWFVARYAERPSPQRALAAGLAIGLTTAVKYNGILLLVPAWLAECMAPGDRRWRVLPSPTGWLLGVTAVASFLLLCPHMVLDFARTYETWLIAKWNVYVTRPESLPPPDAGFLERAWLFVRTRTFGYHLTLSLRYGCGFGVAALTPLALVAALRGGAHPMLRLSAAFAVLYFVVAGASPVHLARYFTPIVPLVLLLVADLVVTTTRALPALWRTSVLALATLALLAEPLHSSLGFDRVAAATDTRVLASEWIAGRPAGTGVAIVGAMPFVSSEPVMPPGLLRVSLPADPRRFASAGIDYVVTVWHHDLGFFAHGTLADLGPLAADLQLVQEFSPFAGPPAGSFEQEDAFFIPFHDFSGVVRPGPLIRIYAPTHRT